MRPTLLCLCAVLIAAASCPAAPPANAPFPPSEAAAHMTLPPGFRATLFAGEPDLVQPIAMTFDDRGRLWVAECLSYPRWNTDPKQGRDRVVIFEDADGTGHFSKRTVFADNLSNVSGLAVGFGGVWVCSIPNFLFIPINDGEEKPAGPPQILLDGWNLKDVQHNVFNSLTFGPDGWLYACNGIQSKSHVGKPGTPDEQRVRFDCGVWRYHPVRHTFEVFCTGTTNPFGLDYDDRGQLFFTNCVIEHLWHAIQGAHFKRMHGEEITPNTYALMQTCADHIHWGGGSWTDSRGGQGIHSTAGGGHAHVGALIYLGDNWPDAYRGTVFTCNLHGNRVNNDLLEHSEKTGSGYVAHHGHDFLMANDPWFRGTALTYGPDGGVFISDWCDTGECHNHVVVDQTNGRVYKVVYGEQPKLAPFDLAKLSDAELVKLQLHKNEWFVRHARRLLQERAAAGKLDAGTIPALEKMLASEPGEANQLRAIWALNAVGAIDEKQLITLMDSPHPYVAGWAIQLAMEGKNPSTTVVQKIRDLAGNTSSATVRLFVASALQRLPIEQRWEWAFPLTQSGKDANDRNLPLMIWYGLEPAVGNDPKLALKNLHGVWIPQVREFLVRRVASMDLGPVVEALATEEKSIADPNSDGGADKTGEQVHERDLLGGLQTALADRGRVSAPEGWGSLYPRLAASKDSVVRQRARLLALKFGDAQAISELKKVAADAAADADERAGALQALVQNKTPDLQSLLQDLLDDARVAGAAVRALAAVGDDSTPNAILAHYAALSESDRRDAVATLSSRSAWALAMLQAADEGKLPRNDLTALTVRQLAALNDPQVNAAAKKLWGAMRPADQDKAALIKQYKQQLTPEVLKKADLSNGRAVFSRTCAQCHTLYDAGGDVGPNLTGSQRANLDYLLENIVDPSAIVAKEYLMTLVKTKDGRVITGIVKEETPAALTLKMPGETLIVPKGEIKSRKTESISMMPEGLLQGMSADEARDLIGYLSGPTQVPLPAGK